MNCKLSNGNRWNQEDMQKLIGMWLRNAEFEEMKNEFNVSALAIRKIITKLRNNGVPLPRRTRGHKAGRQDKLWTQEEIEYLFKRREQGVTVEEIANELDRSFFSIQGMISKLRNEENIDVKKFGGGRKRLWDAEKLTMAIVGRGLKSS